MKVGRFLASAFLLAVAFFGLLLLRGSHGVAAQPPSGPFFGNGQNGDLVVSSGQTVYTDTIRTALPSGVAAGQNTLPIGTASGFAAGQEILIIQMVGPGAGLYEFGTIQSISSNSLTLAQNLVNSYAQGGPSTTQVLLVSNYQNVTVAGGGILTAHAWDGSTGGIVVFRASGTLNVQSGGIIQTNTSGFRGGIIPNTGWTSSGYNGESYTGPSTHSDLANGGGGAGGCDFQNQGGSGGGYGTQGGVGGGNFCALQTQAGATYGDPTLATFFLGSGGGSGGGCCANGGNGGGGILIFAQTISISGTVGSNGGNGQDGSAGPPINYPPGGAGSGGSIRLVADTVNLGNNLVTATGGIGGRAFNTYGPTVPVTGGNGGDGRIRIEYCNTLSGTTTPSAGVQQLNCNVPPTVTPPADQKGTEGTPTSINLGSFSDADGDSPWSVTVDWGDGSGATTFNVITAGSLGMRSHTFADNGSYTVTVRVTDSQALSGSATFQVAIANVPPSATFNAQTGINEGSSLTLSLTNPSDPSPVDTAAGFHYSFACDGLDTTLATSYAAAGTAASTTCLFPDSGSYLVKGRIFDKDDGSTTYSATIVVNNVPPAVGPISAPTAPIQVNTSFTASASFTDPGVLDTHTATWDWGDSTTSAGVVTESNGSGTVSGTHTYMTAGVYTITLTVADNDGRSGQSVFQYVVVYNPSAGFVTGGGWITSPAGAYPANPNLSGKVTFGFDSKYQKGATVPTGTTQFQFQVANLDFHSTNYQWLVISRALVQYKGTGTINGAGNYTFLLTAVDGERPDGGGVDTFRIKIWDTATGTIIYDNQLGNPDTATPTTVLGGGDIVIHS